MARRRHWTFWIMTDGEPTARQLRVSRELARLAIAVVLLLVAGASSAITNYVVRGDKYRADQRLIESNRVLRRELFSLTSRIDTLRSSLETLDRQDDAFRLVAGLEPLPVDVRRVGVGGPDADSLETQPLWSMEKRTARRAYASSLELNTLLRRARLLAYSWREAEDTVRERTARFEATPSIVPTSGYISSGYSGARWHPILDRPRPHKGLDIVAPYGTPIVASARGRVSFVGTSGEYGLTVEVDHGYGLVTRYAHTSRALVRRGQLVQRGDTIARVGKSGLAVGSHLHYEVLVNGRPANPRRYIFDLNVVPD
jgi:murein DD-endopeptidase MepM/ murein hydrolase activator NlpD